MTDSDQGPGPTESLTPAQRAAFQRWEAAAARYAEADKAWREATAERAAAVAELRASGLSLSQIGSLTGLDKAQASKLAAKAQNSSSR